MYSLTKEDLGIDTVINANIVIINANIEDLGIDTVINANIVIINANIEDLGIDTVINANIVIPENLVVLHSPKVANL